LPEIGRDICWPPASNYFAGIEHGESIGDRHDEAHVVLDQQHGAACLPHLVDDRAEFICFGGSHACRRFVKQRQLRIADQGAGDFAVALLDQRQVARITPTVTSARAGTVDTSTIVPTNEAIDASSRMTSPIIQA
jgi:hypothetical protein